MRKTFLLLSGLSALALLVSPAAQAQMPEAAPIERPETIPLEVAMVYAKLLNARPAFDELAQNSPRLQDAPEFGRDALIAEEKAKLEKVFAQIKRNNLIITRLPMAIGSIAPSLQTLEFKGLDADTPFTYPVGPVTYGVFIRNAAAMTNPIQAPFFKGNDWSTLQSLSIGNQMPMVELTLKPMGADEQNFTTYQDDIVKPIIADLIEIRILDPKDNSHLLLSKRDEKAFAETNSDLEDLVQDDLKEPADASLSAEPLPKPAQ